MLIFLLVCGIVFLFFCAINLPIAIRADQRAMKWAFLLSLTAPLLIILGFFALGAIKGGFAWSFGDPKFPFFIMQLGIPFGILGGIAAKTVQAAFRHRHGRTRSA